MWYWKYDAKIQSYYKCNDRNKQGYICLWWLIFMLVYYITI